MTTKDKTRGISLLLDWVFRPSRRRVRTANSCPSPRTFHSRCRLATNVILRLIEKTVRLAQSLSLYYLNSVGADLDDACATILLAETEAALIPVEERDHLLAEKELVVRYGSQRRSVLALGVVQHGLEPLHQRLMLVVVDLRPELADAAHVRDFHLKVGAIAEQQIGVAQRVLGRTGGDARRRARAALVAYTLRAAQLEYLVNGLLASVVHVGRVRQH